MDREFSMRRLQVRQDFQNSCLGGCDVVAVVAAPCGLQSPLAQEAGRFTPPRPPARNLPVCLSCKGSSHVDVGD